MRKYLVLIFLLIMVPFIHPYTESLGTIKQYGEISLIQTCPDSSDAMITRVVYPDKTFALDGVYEMDKNGNNYNFTFVNTSQLGQYLVYGMCDNTLWQYDFYVVDEKPSWFIMILLYGLIFSLMILSFYVDYSDALLSISSGLMLVAGLLIMFYDYGISSFGIRWAMFIVHAGVALLVSFKNIEGWVGGER